MLVGNSIDTATYCGLTRGTSPLIPLGVPSLPSCGKESFALLSSPSWSSGESLVQQYTVHTRPLQWGLDAALGLTHSMAFWQHFSWLSLVLAMLCSHESALCFQAQHTANHGEITFAVTKAH